jgi:hypothetical protein
VGDVRVRTTVTATSVDTRFVKLELLDKDRVLEAEVPVGSGNEAVLRSGGVVLARGTVSPLRPGQPAKLELAFADERAWLRVGGADVLSWDDPHAPAEPDGTSVRLGCGPGGASFADTCVDRDLFWIALGGGRGDFDPTWQPVKIPEDSYFMMGDNSPSSLDSRDWGFVREPLLVGRAFFVWWPLDQVKLIR